MTYTEIMKRSCLKVARKKGESVRKSLIESDYLDQTVFIASDEEYLYLPLGLEDFDKIANEFPSFEIIEMDLKPRREHIRSYKDLLDIPGELHGALPSSYDIIGEVAIIKIPDALVDYRHSIGKALSEANRNIRKVAVDLGVKGDNRVRDLEVIFGDDDLETTHVENNLRFKLDPGLVYFSPRLATERMRIANLTGNEEVLDMFAGVGPFALTIGRHSPAKRVVGIDLNPDCIRFFKLNISLNGLNDIVEAHVGDASEISGIFGEFQRIIMNLPHTSIEYLEPALDMIENGMIHLYRIIDADQVMTEIGRIIETGKQKDRNIEISGVKEVHNYSPSMHMMVFDLLISTLN